MSALLKITNITVEGLCNNLSFSVDAGQAMLVRVRDDRDVLQFLHLLLGERLPESGSIQVQDFSWPGCTYDQLRQLRRMIAVVSAQHGLISNLKLWENIILPVLYHDSTVSETTEQLAASLLSELGYTGNIWALPGHLTSHERIIASYIRAVVSSARIIVYTDIIADLPAGVRARVQTAMTKLHTGPDAPAALIITPGNESYPFISLTSDLDLRDSNR